MPTYIQDMSYTMHTIARVTHQLKIVEEADIPNIRNKLTFSVIRTNSGKEADGGDEHIKIKLNGKEICDQDLYTPQVPAYGSDEIKVCEYYIQNTGSNNFSVSANYRCDNIDGGLAGIIAGFVWGTFASCSIDGSLTPIDQSSPVINSLTVESDRYGANASVSFEVSHSVYDIRNIKFKLSDLTYGQAAGRWRTYRRGQHQGDYVTAYDYGQIKYDVDTKYYFELERALYSEGTSAIMFFDLSDRNSNYHLDSGGSYTYEFVVTALNGKSTTINGTLKVPQKVTGFTCEDRIDMMPGETVSLKYHVTPDNAEDPTVKFSSSNPSVATVDENTGLITAVGEGVCQIIATTVDGGEPDAPGFTQRCSVSVLNTEVFPTLKEIQYLTDREIIKISAACKFLYEKLSEKGISVPTLSIVACEGKNHPVKGIITVLETINSNCFILKNATDGIYPTEHLSEQRNFLKENIGMNWYRLVNEWIDFLNELNEKI